MLGAWGLLYLRSTRAMKIFFRLFLIGLVLACTACSSLGKDRPEKTVQQLIQDGVAAYDLGNFADALENFEQLKNWYPFSKYAILAELKIADANYQIKQYPEAIAAYEDFERLHPRNEAIPYVIYQIGRCHFEQIDAIDQDQTSARKALEIFRRLVNQYPRDAYSRTAQTHIVFCLQSLAEHDFYIGKYYFKAKHYDAALERFLSIVRKYPDVGIHHAALMYVAKCRAFLENEE